MLQRQSNDLYMALPTSNDNSKANYALALGLRRSDKARFSRQKLILITTSQLSKPGATHIRYHCEVERSIRFILRLNPYRRSQRMVIHGRSSASNQC
jgi:hypothetical protein